MNVGIVCDSRPCSHDYGVDYLIQGAYSVLGSEHICELPVKPHLHLATTAKRDACQIDSDAWLPLPTGPQMPDDWHVLLLTSAYGTKATLSRLAPTLPSRIPVIGLKYDDEAGTTQAIFEQQLGRSLTAYFQREGAESSDRQLWLSQPHSRIRPIAYKPPWAHRVCYYGTSNLTSRHLLLDSVRSSTSAAERDLLMTSNKVDRLPIELYRERLWESSISIVWNSGAGFPTWDCNRFWESLALGCYLIAERPSSRQMPIGLHDCIDWIASPSEAGTRVRWALDHPGEARERASAAQAAFAAHHTSEHRFQSILRSAGIAL